MQRHFFLIDPLEKLNPKKDSSLLLMLSFQEKNIPVFAILKQDLCLSFASGQLSMPTYILEGHIEVGNFYLKDIQLIPGPALFFREEGDILHMRLDPPFDENYLKTLWALDYLQSQGVRVYNNPRGILTVNEKLSVFRFGMGDYPFVLSGNREIQKSAIRNWQKSYNIKELVIKPLNLFQGYGVTKVTVEEFLREDATLGMDWGQSWIIVPFFEQIYEGEYRCAFFNGKLLGSIKKIPPKGSFLANIAQGAQFQAVQIPLSLEEKLEKNAIELKEQGILWVAYDCIGEHVSEINVTCPGLLVELSHAHEKNLALKITQYFQDNPCG